MKGAGPSERDPSTRCYTTGPLGDLDRYTVTAEDMEHVRVGGEGLLYRARSSSTGRQVALKLLSNTPMADFERVQERAALFTLLGHEGLMTQLETFVGPALCEVGARDEDLDARDCEVLYSVAEWIEGSSLDEAAVGVPTRQRLEWIAQIAEALAVLHDPSPGAPKGLVHRDVKPSNIRVRPDGHVVLVDFGVARQVGFTDMTEGIGTFRWRAPEVLSGSRFARGPAVDTWGLGAVAHWLLLGDAPDLDGASAAQERLANCAALGDLPRGRAIAGHVAALLHTHPSKRPTDLRVWAADLRRMSRSRFSPAKALREFGVTSAVATVALVALVGWVGYLATRTPESPSRTTTTDTPITTGSPTTTVPPATTAAPGALTITCRPFSVRLRPDVPIGHTPRTVGLSLASPPEPIACAGSTSVAFVLEDLDLALPDLSCDAIPGTPGHGGARLRLPDGSTIDTDVSVGFGDHPTAAMHSAANVAEIDADIGFTFGVAEGSCDGGGVSIVSFDSDDFVIRLGWSATLGGA